MMVMQMYKHKNCRDVAVMPLKITHLQHGVHAVIKLKWFNIVNENRLDLNLTEEVVIKIADLNNWKLLTSDEK